MHPHSHRIPLWPRTGLALGLGCLAGGALQVQQAQLWPLWVYMCFIALAPVLYAWGAPKTIAKQPRPWLVFGAALACTLGLAGVRSDIYLGQALEPALEGRDLLVTGVVDDLPTPSPVGLRFRLRSEQATLDGLAVQIPALLDLGWYSSGFNTSTGLPELQRSAPALRAGERWRMQLRLKAPHGSRNPGGFDYELYLWEQGVQATGYVRASPSAPLPQRLGQTWRAPVALARQVVRDRIYAQLSPAADAPPGSADARRRAAGLLAALVVGDQRAIEHSDWDVFRATGVGHLVSISGLHITLFAWAAIALVGWAWRRSAWLCARWPAPPAAWLCGVALAWGYAVFSGWGVPAQRTCWMLAVVLLLRAWGLRWPWPWVALWTAVLVLLLDPWALMQAGFWLSFVAVLVLFVSSDAIKTIAAHADGVGVSAGFYAQVRAVGAGLLRALYQALRRLLREQGVITLALMPLGLLLFGQTSVVGLLANLVAIPWVTLVLTPLALLGVVWPVLWDWAAQAAALLFALLDALSTWPGAQLLWPAVPLPLGAVAVLGGVLLALPLPWRLRCVGLPLVLPVLLWQPARPAPGVFELLAPDIGQGNAVLVRTAGHALLFDTGPRYSLESDAGNRVLVPLLQSLQLRLDTVVLSHRDSDHAGGAAAVQRQQSQAAWLSSFDLPALASTNTSTNIPSNIPSNAAAVQPNLQRCQAGMHWRWDGVDFAVLHPRADDYQAQPAPAPNALSCVLRISNGQQVALLTGDIEKTQEQRLLLDPQMRPLLKADVLLVPHHGSQTSSSPDFVQAVAPLHALVQAGYRNRYGHPAAPVVQRYAQERINLVSSPRCGAARWSSAQPQTVACMREDERRYWHHRVP